jgi:hypothetical protein
MIMVSRALWSVYSSSPTTPPGFSKVSNFLSLEGIGIAQKIFYSKEILGLLILSRSQVFVDVVVLDSRVV